MKDFILNRNKEFLRKRLGSMSQLAGLKRYRLSEGRADGVDAVDVRTGTGFSYTVLPGRGMDLAWTEYKGVPISYMSSTGVSAAAHYEAAGMEWLRNFFAGMLTTCGFDNVGGPSEETHPVIGKRNLGLHGRLTNIPASEVSATEEWEGERYVMRVSGKMRQSCLHGENLTLRRTVTSVLGESKLALHDRIENESNRELPFALLYHMNVGYPILSEDTRLYISSESLVGASDLAREEIERYDSFHAPEAGCVERCYFHTLKADEEGKAYVAVVNEALQLAVVFTYLPSQLPAFTEWKMLNEGEYVLGIEPGTNNPVGRAGMAEAGTLQHLRPGETRDVDVTIEVLDSAEEIEAIKNKIKAMRENA